MKTVGSILKEAREAQHLSLSEVEQATKIREKFLEAIEQDDYAGLPSLAYVKGFVKNYSDFLGLESSTTLAFFRRQTNDTSKSHLLPKGVREPLNRSPFQLTPRKFLIFFVAGLMSIFLTYLGLQYQALNRVPILVIQSPKDKAVLTERRIDVLGKTDADATVSVNGVSVLVRSDGKFFEQVILDPGINHITILSTSRLGKSTTVILEVVFSP